MKSKHVQIPSKTGDPLQIAQYLYLLSREPLHRLCRQRGVIPARHKGATVDRLSANFVDHGGELLISVHVPAPKK